MGTILGWHSITTPEWPARGEAHLPLQFFRRAVHLARRMGEIVALDELLNRHAEGRSTNGLVALTFDDAYAALGGEFAAFIERESVPISVFVVSGAAADGAAFWWDRVDDAFPRVSRSRWRAFEDACGLPPAYRERQPREYGPLRPLRQWILKEHAGRWPRALEPALERLEADAGEATRQRPMTFEELADLAKLESVQFGVHTASHAVLPLLPDEEVRREITECYRELRSRFDHVVPVLAFPFALFDQRSVDIARSAGMTAGLTLTGSNITPGADIAAMPRVCLTTRDSLPRLALKFLGVQDTVKAWAGAAPPKYPDLPSVDS
jgi:peptidoglycan/xylan/chitin deacetylase (PgdA/CDA1 family)